MTITMKLHSGLIRQVMNIKTKNKVLQEDRNKNKTDPKLRWPGLTKVTEIKMRKDKIIIRFCGRLPMPMAMLALFFRISQNQNSP